MAVQLATQLEVNLQVAVPMAKILGAATFIELASFVLNQMVNGTAGDKPVSHLSKADAGANIFPVTWQQESLWLQHQTKGAGSQTLNILLAIRLKGRLHVGALEQSLNAIVSRHAILRTTYSLVDEKPVQIISSPVPVNLPVDSLLMMPKATREAEVCRRAAKEAQFFFNLETGPLIKPHLLKVAPEEHVLLIVTHHIACDGWSIQLLLKELSRFYQIFSKNETPGPILPELPYQYSAFAQRQPTGSIPKVWETQLQYWKRQLGGNLPELILPRDRVRSRTLRFNSAQEPITIPDTLATALRALSSNEEVTLFTVLLSAFKILLCRYSQQTDIVVGSSVANRHSADVQEMIGPFTNAVALRTFFYGDPDVRQILNRVKQVTLGAYANQEVPFDVVLRETGWKTGRPAPFDAVFLFQNFLVPVWNMRGVAAQLEEFETGLGNFELALVIYEKAGALVGALKFNTDLYDRKTIQDLTVSYLAILEQIGKAPETRLSQFEITEELASKPARSGDQQWTIAVAATFVPDLVKPSLDFWMEELKIPGRIEFAPYNQVFQQLLDPGGLFCTNRNGLNVILIRFADWYREDGGKMGNGLLPGLVERRMNDLITALKTAAAGSSVPYLICTCPSVSDNSTACNGLFQKLERRLRAESKNIPNLYFVDAPELLALYPVPVIYDPCTDELGHIPFSPAFFTALGTVIARKVHALRAAPSKVIVLDCDQTLWKGICGEDGVDGVEIDPARQALQEFMIAQHDSGMILCLVSKNDEQDVLEVFQRHPDIRLKLEHITARQINWNAKSENLKLLSQQLGLGLESFVFIDDNPMECAEVEAACPGVLVLQLPENSEDILKFPQHVWAFDKLRVTEEDKRRTDFYQQDMRRERLRSEVLTLSDFISSLNLECKISEMKPEQIGRVAQLTQRTNQFNTTAIRRSESEIREFCGQAKHGCCVVEAKDRFGDYGLVGAMFTEEMSGVLHADSFLLSCHALGRGIEHQMLAHLGKRGLERGARQIHFSIVHTSRNRPVMEFLESTGGVFIEEPRGRFSFQIPVGGAASAKYAPSQKEHASVPVLVQNHATPTSYRLDSKIAMRIATQLCDVEQIDKAIDDQQRQFPPQQKGYIAPRTPIEEMLATIWANILRLERVGIHDNFIELGGHSLLGTVLISHIRKVFGVELPLNVILEKPTIAQLAGVIEQEVIGRLNTQDMDAAVQELEAISDDEARLLLRDEANYFGLNENQ
jgi:FkbH-like protein